MFRPWRALDRRYAAGLLEGITARMIPYVDTNGNERIEPVTSGFRIFGPEGVELEPADVLRRDARFSDVRVYEEPAMVPTDEPWPDGMNLGVMVGVLLPHLAGTSHTRKREQPFVIGYANGHGWSQDEGIAARITAESHRVIERLEEYMVSRPLVRP